MFVKSTIDLADELKFEVWVDVIHPKTEPWRTSRLELFQNPARIIQICIELKLI